MKVGQTISENTSNITHHAVPGKAYDLGKRLFDLVGAAFCLVLTSPVMVICACWIKLTDGGPVLYKQWRVGKNGWLFRVYKFRTMRMNAETDGIQFAATDDPRVMPGCNFLRKSHIDELPQLFNILFGQMSLVGPRPERPEIFEEFRHDMPGFERRLAAAPGLTGLAQVRNGYTNDKDGMRRKLAYDLRYLRRRTLFGDLLLVMQTIPKFWDRSAC